MEILVIAAMLCLTFVSGLSIGIGAMVASITRGRHQA